VDKVVCKLDSFYCLYLYLKTESISKKQFLNQWYRCVFLFELCLCVCRYVCVYL